MSDRKITKECSNCKKYSDEILLLKGKLKDMEVIYGDSVDTYRKALRDREYELILRECEIVKELDTYKKTIDKLHRTITELQKGITKHGLTVEFIDNKAVISNKKVKAEVKENVNVVEKKKVKANESKDVVVKAKVKENVKKELKKTQKSEKKGEINSELGIILPLFFVGESEEEKLRLQGEDILKNVKSKLDEIGEVGYLNRRIDLVRLCPEFFVSLKLLSECYPNSKGTYQWSKVTEILEEREDYNKLTTMFLSKTGAKLNYLNVRNWYGYIGELLTGKKYTPY